MKYSMEFAAGWWSWSLAGLALTALAWHVSRSRAPRWLLAMRAAGALMLVLALLKPSLVHRQAGQAKPKLAILVDASHSMGGRAGATTRLDAARSWLRDHRRRIEERADVALFTVAGGARRLVRWEELDGAAPASAAFQPGQALREAADDAALTPAPHRAWLLTDGNAEAASDVDEALGALKAPIDVIGVGPARRERGLSFAEIKTPDFAFLHARFQVQVAVDASDLAGQDVRLRLLREQPGGKGWASVDERELRPASDYEALTATFTAAAQSLGAERYRVEARLPGGSARAREFRVEVIRQKYRIMFLAGRPSAEYAQLREFLKSDPNHELVSFVILRNPENPSFVSDNELSLIPFPADEIFVKSLNQFDLFILENFSYARFQLPTAYLESLKAFVANGGALLVIGGENAFGLGGYRGTPVEEMLPVTLASAADFTAGLFSPRPAAKDHPLVRLYDTPEASQAAWDALPPLDGFARFASVKAGATVLAVHPTERTAQGQPLPVLAIREYGRGKVMLASSDSTWRWRLGAASDWRIGAFYARFWTKAVQFLTGSLDLSKVKFAPLPDRLPAREPAAFSLRVFDESFRPAERTATDLAVLWTAADGKTREVVAQETEPGIYSIELTGLTPGTHRLRASARYHGRPWGEDAIRFEWENAAAEAPMDRRWITRAAQATGGGAHDLVSANIGALLEALPAVREEAHVRRRTQPWLSTWWLSAAAALLLAEWALRRWRGLA